MNQFPRAEALSLDGGERVLRRFAALVNVVLLILLAYLLAKLTWMLLPRPPQDQVVPDAAPAFAAATPRAGGIDVAPLAQLHLFGVVQEVIEEPEVAPPQVAPDTKLSLTLRGAFFSDPPDDARAIIAEANGRDRVYGIGAELPGGGKLVEIHPDRVILSREGTFETLRFPPVDQRLLGVVRRSPLVEVEDADERSEQRVARDLARYQKRLRENPGSLIGLVNMEPITRGEAFVGYRVAPGRDRGLLRRLGLRSGDILTSVNGIPLDSPTKGLDVLQELAGALQLDVQVERGEQQLQFSFNVEP